MGRLDLPGIVYVLNAQRVLGKRVEQGKHNVPVRHDVLGRVPSTDYSEGEVAFVLTLITRHLVSKQPIRTRYLGHVTGIRDQYF